MTPTNLTLAALASLFGSTPCHAAKIRCYYGTSNSTGIYFSVLDTQKGTLSAPKLAFKIEKPGFIALHPAKPYLYATTPNIDGENGGGVVAFKINLDGSLARINHQSSEGKNPCHVSIDSTGQCLLVANYSSGNVASFRIQADGSLSPAQSIHQHEGAGTHPQRQKGPYAHSIFPNPENTFAYASDLGIDKIMIYALDPQQATLSDPQFAVVPGGGMGPRHMKWSADGKTAYVINELDVSISIFSRGQRAGSLHHELTQSLLPKGSDLSGLTSAEIRIHSNEKWIYASTRDLTTQGRDSIAIFSRFEDGFKPLGVQSAHVSQPRNFNIDPTGQWMLVGGQVSHDIALFKVDPTTGQLTLTGPLIPFEGSPVCIEFSRTSF